MQSGAHSKQQLYSPRSNNMLVSESAVTQRRFSGIGFTGNECDLPLQLPGYGFKRTFNISQSHSHDNCDDSQEPATNTDLGNVLSRGDRERPVLRELNSQSLSAASRGGSRSSQRLSHSPVLGKNSQHVSHQLKKAKMLTEWQERVNQKVQQKEERRTSLQRQRQLMHKSIR